MIVPILLRHVEHHGDNREKRIGFPCIVLSNIEAEEIDPGRKVFRVAEILGLSVDRVSVKATTTEKLGFTGRGEGVAAQAVATIALPR